MAIEVSPPAKPTLTANGTNIASLDLPNSSDNSFTSNRAYTAVTGPVTLVLSGPAGATIRYTFNGKKVNLGSEAYSAPLTITQNGNGFDSDTLTLRAKSYLNGEVSGTAEFRLVVQ